MVLSKRKSYSSVNNKNLISYSHPDSIISEQFRMIQTNIKFLSTEQKCRIILITSPTAGEGKSVIAANLAVSMAQQKDKVLLIDANLRTPVQHDIFNISNSTGLTDVLNGREDLSGAVYHTEIGKLDVLPSGILPDNPSELLGSAIMQELLNKAIKTYDAILLDSYAVNDVSDTKLLAKNSDGVVLVIQNGKTTREKAEEAKKELEYSKAALMGIILNDR